MEPDGPWEEVFDGRKGDPFLTPLTVNCLSFKAAIVTIARIEI